MKLKFVAILTWLRFLKSIAKLKPLVVLGACGFKKTTLSMGSLVRLENTCKHIYPECVM